MSGGRRLVLTSLLEEPGLSMGILGAGVAHVALTGMGLEGWPCPFYKVTGRPCPGCGLGRACVLLLKGHWQDALRIHAFAPVLLVVLAVLAAGLALRGRPKTALCRAISRLEAGTRLDVVLLTGLMVYWFLRLVLDESHLQMLVS